MKLSSNRISISFVRIVPAFLYKRGRAANFFLNLIARLEAAGCFADLWAYQEPVLRRRDLP